MPCAGPLTHSWAVTRQEACRKHLLVFNVLLRMVKRVSVGRSVWIFCCGCGHCWPNLSLCGQGVGLCLKEQSCYIPRCVSLLIPGLLPPPPLLERVSLSKNCGCPLQFSACIRHAVKSLLLTGRSLNPPRSFSGKRTYFQLYEWRLRFTKGSSFGKFTFF